MRKLLLLCLITGLASAASIHAQEPEPYRIALRVDSDLYTIDSNGENLTPFPYDRQQYDEILSAIWSPDGEQVLLLMANREELSARLMLADSDGSNPRFLLDDPVSINAAPLWSRDGTHIGYLDMVDGQQQLFVIEADGSNQRLPPPVAWDAPRPHMSPDGRQVALLTGLKNHLSITVTDLETGRSPELVHNMADDYFSWSPAGDTIAFHHWGGSEDIYTVNIETGEISQLVQDEVVSEELYFDWSSDGSQIAVTSNRSGIWQIYTMNPDGSDLHQLTDGSYDAYSIAYSPDNQWIAYNDFEEIWIIHPDGSGARQMTFAEQREGFYGWSPDSAEMLILRFDERNQLFVVDVETGRARELPGPPGDIRFATWIGR